MDPFEAYYRNELAYLRLLGRDMARDHPHLRDFLGESSADPDVERLLEGFSILTARLQQKINDAFPEITHPLLSLAWSQLLRLHPATTIVAFRGATPDVCRRLPAGTTLLSQPRGDEPACRFQTCRELLLLPLSLGGKELTHLVDGSQLNLTFHWHGQPLGGQPLPIVTLFLGAERTRAGLLTLWFEQYLTKATLSQGGQVYPLDTAALIPEAITPVLPPLSDEKPFRSHLQQMQEYLYSPLAGQFVQLDLSRALPEGVTLEARFTLNCHFDRLLPPAAQTLPADMQLNCVPAINLFSEDSLILRPQDRDAHCFPEPTTPGAEISAVTGVSTWQEPGELCGQQVRFLNITGFIRQFEPVMAATQLFYQVSRQRDGLGRIQHQLSFINPKGEPVSQGLPPALVCHLLCTDGSRAERLQIGELSLPAEDTPGDVFFSNVTSVSSAWPAMEEGPEHWQLLSHLILSPLSLERVDAVRQIISDFDFRSRRDTPHRQRLQQRLRGLVDLKSRPVDWLFNGIPRRGMRCEITLDADSFEDEGECYRFGVMLSRFLAATLTARSFLMIELINASNGERWSVPMITGYHPEQ